MPNNRVLDSTPIYVRAPLDLDVILEQIARVERRSKTAVVALALEEYVAAHHPVEFNQYKERRSCPR